MVSTTCIFPSVQSGCWSEMTSVFLQGCWIHQPAIGTSKNFSKLQPANRIERNFWTVWMAKEIPGKQQKLLWNLRIMHSRTANLCGIFWNQIQLSTSVFWLWGGRSSEDAARKGARVFSVRTPACSDGNGMTLKIGVKSVKSKSDNLLVRTDDQEESTPEKWSVCGN